MAKMDFFYWLRLQFWRVDMIGGLARMLILTPGAPVDQAELDSFEEFLLVDNPSSKTLIALEKARAEYYGT